jgi:hypothetical protein
LDRRCCDATLGGMKDRRSRSPGARRARIPFGFGTAVSLCALVATDGWRTATLAAAVACLVSATRVRFAALAALVVLMATAAIAASGRAGQHDRRTPHHASPRAAEPARGA